MNLGEAQNIYGKIKILHIDDDELQLKILKENLSQINKNIIIESEKDPFEALKKIENNFYDCILLDYLIPLINGIEIAHKIRLFSNVPIILYTVQEIDEMDENFFNINIDEYIKKELSINNYFLIEKKILNLVYQYRKELLFKEITEKIINIIILIDNNYNIRYFNKNFEVFFGNSNFLGKNISEILDKNYEEPFLEYLNDPEVNEIETVMKDFADVNKYVIVSKSNLDYIEDYLFLEIKDITNQILKSGIDYSNDDRFTAISNMSPDAISTINMFGYVTYINPSFSKLTGFSESEIIGKHMLSIPTIKGRNLLPYLDLLKNFFKGKMNATSIEFPYTRKDGSSGIGDAYLDTIKVKGKREFIAIIKDVTDKKIKEEEYQYIFKYSPEGIIHLDLNGVIKNINESAIKLLEINPKEYIGKNIFETLDEIKDTRYNFIKLYEDVISNKDVNSFEINIKINERFKWFLISVGLIKIYEEKLGIQIIIREITKQKEIEEERKKYTENLEKMVEDRTNQILDNEKMVTLAKISSMIAHDLKGPLQTISNSLHLMKLRPDEKDKYIEYIRMAVKQSNELIEEMQVRSKETPLKIEQVNLGELIEESLLQVKVTENIRFKTDIRINNKVSLDRSKFIRVFNNMFKNAIEAMPYGGRITVIATEEDEKVSIKIIDTGKGIPEEKINNLFRPFQSTKSKGIGLGLNFCKNTIEAHGGNILVQSEVGKGTVFTISLPLNIENYQLHENQNMLETKDTLIK